MKSIINIILLFLTSCTSETRVHDITILRLPQLKELSNLRPGVIRELSPRSEASWIYLTISKRITVTWSVYPSAAIPMLEIPDDGWESQLIEDCQAWSAASAKVNGFPETVHHAAFFINNGISAPIFKWSGEKGQRIAYISSVRINTSNLRAQLHAEAANDGAQTISIEDATRAFEELTSSDAWRNLYNRT